MAFEGIIPWLRDYKNRNSMDQFLGKYGVALQSGDPDAIAKIPVDPRNPYQQQAVSQALQAWNTAGQGGLIRANTAHTGAQTGLVNQQTRNAGQAFDINAANEERTKTAEGWINDKFKIPNAQAFNMSLQDRSAKVGERNAATHEGQLGVQQADQKAKFAGHRMAAIGAGIAPLNLTQPTDTGPLLDLMKIQEGDKNRDNLTRLQELSNLVNLYTHDQMNRDTPQGQAITGEINRRLGIQLPQGAQQNSRVDAIQNATQQHAERDLTFGSNTPPLNMENPASNFTDIREQAGMGARALAYRMGLAENPFRTEVRQQYPQRGERNANLPNGLLFQQPPRVELNQPTNQAPQQVFMPPPITNNPPAFNPASVAIPDYPRVQLAAMTNQNPQLQMTQQDIFRDVAQRYQQQSPNEQFKQMQSMTPEQQAMLLQMIADLMGGQPQQR